MFIFGKTKTILSNPQTVFDFLNGCLILMRKKEIIKIQVEESSNRKIILSKRKTRLCLFMTEQNKLVNHP